MAELKSTVPSTGFYIIIWVALLILLATNIALSKAIPNDVGAFVIMLVAMAQAGLVILYFMHLRQEKGLLLKVIVIITVVLIAVLKTLVFSDVAYR